jgi:hypothetical protein
VVTVTGPSTGTNPSRTLTIAIGLAVATRPNLVRVDILSLKSDVAALPNLHVTAVLDRRANTVTLWNDAVKHYYLLAFLPQAAPTTGPSRSPTPVPRAVSPLSGLDLLAIAITMTGHTVTNGVPTTGLSFDMRVAKKGHATPVHVTATAQIADDSAWLPMTIDAVVDPGTPPVGATFAYAIDDLTRGLPPLGLFTIPPGYTRTNTLWAIIPHGK